MQPLAHVYDGFLVHSRGARERAVAGAAAVVPAPTPTLIRTDLDVPVFVFQTETDVVNGFTARQDDSDLYRAVGGRGDGALRPLRPLDRSDRHR